MFLVMKDDRSLAVCVFAVSVSASRPSRRHSLCCTILCPCYTMAIRLSVVAASTVRSRDDLDDCPPLPPTTRRRIFTSLVRSKRDRPISPIPLFLLQRFAGVFFRSVSPVRPLPLLRLFLLLSLSLSFSLHPSTLCLSFDFDSFVVFNPIGFSFHRLHSLLPRWSSLLLVCWLLFLWLFWFAWHSFPLVSVARALHLFLLPPPTLFLRAVLLVV